MLISFTFCYKYVMLIVYVFHFKMLGTGTHAWMHAKHVQTKKMLHLNPEHASHFAPHICIHWTIMNLVHLSKL